MAWLLAHMWAALAGVAIFGLLLGWSIRGMMLVGKMRKAMVERDVTKTELEQAKEEIESLYAAQRGKQIGSDPALQSDLRDREAKLAQLQTELATAKNELGSLKARPAATDHRPATASEAAPSAAAPMISGESPHASLVWRNRHLESRVRHLESLVSSPMASGDMAEAVTQADTAPAAGDTDALRTKIEALEAELTKVKSVAAAPVARNGDMDEELARLRWRNRFLEGRLAYFEGDADARQAAEEVTAVKPEAPLTEVIAEEPEPETEAEDIEVSEAEIAEEAEPEMVSEEAAGRAILASLELTDEDDVQDDVADDADGETEDDESSEYADESEDTVDTDEDEDDEYVDEFEDDDAEEYDLEDDSTDEVESEDDETDEGFDVEEDDDTEAGSEAEDEVAGIAAEEEAPTGERPLALDGPVAGQPDDLTVIGGVGPKIQELLNEMGIWHYDQIAAWSEENVIWVDRELNFSGRIVREGWVQQAASLAGDMAEEDAF